MGLNFKSGVKPWKAEESDRRLEWTQELWLGDMCKMKDVQDEVNQEESEHNEVDGMKKGADSTGKVMHVWKSGWWFVMRKIRMVELGWQLTTDEEWVLPEDWAEIKSFR